MLMLKRDLSIMRGTTTPAELMDLLMKAVEGMDMAVQSNPQADKWERV
jgi:hypothetical protein